MFEIKFLFNLIFFFETSKLKKCFGKKEIGHCVRKDQDKNFDFNFSKAATKIENRKPETGNRNEITTRISKLMKVGIALGSVAAIFKAPMRLVTQSVVGQGESLQWA